MSSPIEEHEYRVGRRYLHGKTLHPLTLRYIGPLPPSTTPPAEAGSSSSSPSIWYAVEFDDASRGKHSGTYNNLQIFECKQKGAGAFIKASPNTLRLGNTFVQAVEERYGALNHQSTHHGLGRLEKVTLGSSSGGIVVEAPNIGAVQRRLGRLEKLRDMGLEGEWICGFGDEGMKDIVRGRLKGLRTLNISRNLVSTWEDLGEIVRCLPGLTTLTMNDSRLGSPEEGYASKETFSSILELHLGRAGLTWQEVLSIMPNFLNLKELHLNDNSGIRDLLSPSNGDTSSLYSKLEVLSLEGCGIGSWDSITAISQRLPSLRSLNISSLPVSSIPPPAIGSAQYFQALERLILLNTRIVNWSDIDNLNRYTSGQLRYLRISLFGVDDASETAQSSDVDPERMTGIARLDRHILIAKLPGLISLNSTAISSSERKDAELYYISYVGKLRLGISPTVGREEWGRYDELCDLYGRPTLDVTVKSSALKTKMINILVYPAHSDPLNISVLPASSIPLLRKKIAKQVASKAAEVKVWTAREIDGRREKAAEITDGGGLVGDWLSESDVVIAETG